MITDPKYAPGKLLYLVDFKTRIVSYVAVESAVLLRREGHCWFYRFPGDDCHYDETCLFETLAEAEVAVNSIPRPEPPLPPPNRIIREGRVPDPPFYREPTMWKDPELRPKKKTAWWWPY